jgi:hypothetical protein
MLISVSEFFSNIIFFNETLLMFRSLLFFRRLVFRNFGRAVFR